MIPAWFRGAEGYIASGRITFASLNPLDIARLGVPVILVTGQLRAPGDFPDVRAHGAAHGGPRRRDARLQAGVGHAAATRAGRPCAACRQPERRCSGGCLMHPLAPLTLISQSAYATFPQRRGSRSSEWQAVLVERNMVPAVSEATLKEWAAWLWLGEQTMGCCFESLPIEKFSTLNAVHGSY